MKTALLVIDVQRGICTGEWAAFDIERVIARINSLSEKSRSVGAPVIFIQHEEDDGPLQFDSEGWQLDDRLDVQAIDLRLRKRTPDSFNTTELQTLLQERGVTNLVVCGLQSDFCVDSTTRRALSLGYPVTLASDAHSTIGNGVLSAAQITAHHNVTLSNIQSFGPRVTAVPAEDIRLRA
jgi:nicotinamidase-related amidase